MRNPIRKVCTKPATNASVFSSYIDRKVIYKTAGAHTELNGIDPKLIQNLMSLLYKTAFTLLQQPSSDTA